MMFPSFYVKGYEYFIASYYRPEIAYRFLQDLLGEKLFKKALQEYINRWNGKYPNPYDFFFTFNDVAGEDLSWFWKPWFFDMGYPDLAIGDIKKNKNEWTIEIKKIGNLPVPIEISIEYTDGSTEKLKYSAKIWKQCKNIFELKHTTNKTIKKIILGSDQIPDINKNDNQRIYPQN